MNEAWQTAEFWQGFLMGWGIGVSVLFFALALLQKEKHNEDN